MCLGPRFSGSFATAGALLYTGRHGYSLIVYHDAECVFFFSYVKYQSQAQFGDRAISNNSIPVMALETGHYWLRCCVGKHPISTKPKV